MISVHPTSISSIHCLRMAAAPGSPADASCRGLAGVLPSIVPPPGNSRVGQDLIYHGGRTISALQFFNFFIGGSAAWSSDERHHINASLSSAMLDRLLNYVVQQYFPGPINSKFLGSRVLGGPPPTVMSEGDLAALIARLFEAGTLHGYDLHTTVFNFLLPSGTVLNASTDITPESDDAGSDQSSTDSPAGLKSSPSVASADSTQGLWGFHGSVPIGDWTILYTVGIYPEKRQSRISGGAPLFSAPWKSVVAIFYHLLNEVRTNPDAAAANRTQDRTLLGWVSQKGEEIGDIPLAHGKATELPFVEVPLTLGTGKAPVQFLYSNAIHGPEGPIARPHPSQIPILRPSPKS